MYFFRYGFYDFKMANQDDLHAVFEMCGITDAATRTLIMNREGFTQLDDLGVLETDSDVTEMAKRMASRTQAEGRVLLGTVIINAFRRWPGGFAITRSVDYRLSLMISLSKRWLMRPK